MTRADIHASEMELERARETSNRLAPLYGVFALIVVSLLCIPASYLASLVASGAAQHLLTAAVLAAARSPRCWS